MDDKTKADACSAMDFTRKAAAFTGFSAVAVGLGGALDVAKHVIDNAQLSASPAYLGAQYAFDRISHPVEVVLLTVGGLCVVGGGVATVMAGGYSGGRSAYNKIKRSVGNFRK